MLFSVHSMLQYNASIPVQYLHCLHLRSGVTFRYCGTVPALPYSVRSEVQWLYRDTVHSSLTVIYSAYTKSEYGYNGY
jgi:hypothetical protein